MCQLGIFYLIPPFDSEDLSSAALPKSTKVNSVSTTSASRGPVIVAYSPNLPLQRCLGAAKNWVSWVQLPVSSVSCKHWKPSRSSSVCTVCTVPLIRVSMEQVRVVGADGNTSLMLFSTMSMPPFRTIKLRARKPTCAACGVDGQGLGFIHETDYVAFCGGPRPDWEARGLVSGNAGDRISVQVSYLASQHQVVSIYFQELQERLGSQEQCMLLDVRPKTEFGICHLPGSLSSINLINLLASFTRSIQAFRCHCYS